MGMSPHEFGRVAYDAGISEALILSDPGTGGTIDMRNTSFAFCPLTIAAATETRSLPTASRIPLGVRLTVVVNQLTTFGTHFATINSDTCLSAEGESVTYMNMRVNDANAWVKVHETITTNVLTLSATATLTTPRHANRLLLMNGAGSARTYTLPATSGTGNVYRFSVKAVNTSNYIIVGATSSDFMEGTIHGFEAADDNEFWPSLLATENIKVTLNGTTQGGATPGDWVEFTDTATNVWSVRGMITQSGVQATPFSTS